MGEKLKSPCELLRDMIKDEEQAQPAYDGLKDALIRGTPEGASSGQNVIWVGIREKDVVELLMDSIKMDEHKHEIILKKLHGMVC